MDARNKMWIRSAPPPDMIPGSGVTFDHGGQERTHRRCSLLFLLVRKSASGPMCMVRN